MLVSNKGGFRVRNKHILLYRIGSANGQKQLHFNSPVSIDGKKLTDPVEIENWKKSYRRPLTRKGIFTFPAPLDDAFYYSHHYNRFLPKYFKNHVYNTNRKGYGPFTPDYPSQELDDYIQKEIDIFYEEKEKKYKEIIKREKKKLIWYSGKFYSHICPKNLINDGRVWWEYNNVAEWVDSARKYLNFYYWDNGFQGKFKTDKGDFELFIPD